MTTKVEKKKRSRRTKLGVKECIRLLEDYALGREELTRDRMGAVLEVLKFKIEKEALAQTQRSRVIDSVVSHKRLQELIGFEPHEEQQKVLDSRANDRVICAGRQGGKTILVAYLILKALLESNKSIVLISPTYTLNSRVLEYLQQWIAKHFRGEIKFRRKPTPLITTKWGSRLECKSGQEPAQILGKGYDFIFVDECARITEETFNTYIVPASGIKVGKSVFISTPRGRNWFWRVWREAEKKGGAFHWTSQQSPYFEVEKWVKEKKRLPEMIFRTEYEAEFLEDAVVFQGIERVLKDYEFPQEYNPKHLYIIGIDLGKYEDFTCISVFDLVSFQLVDFQRFQGDWALQKEKIIAVANKYANSELWLDTTSISSGDVFCDELVSLGYSVIGYKIQSNISKRQLIEKLCVLIQNGTIQIPKDNEITQILIEELRAFSYSITAGGVIRYSAPQGLHDDSVISLALSVFDIEEPLDELIGGQIVNEAYTFPRQEY